MTARPTDEEIARLTEENALLGRKLVLMQDEQNRLAAEIARLTAALCSPADGWRTTLTILRDAGWFVAVHNDYRLDGKRWTFWLLTHDDGRYVKGEGATDEEALAEAWAKASLPSPPAEEKTP